MGPGNTEPGNVEPGNTEPGNTEPGNTELGNMEPGTQKQVKLWKGKDLLKPTASTLGATGSDWDEQRTYDGQSSL